MLPKFIKDIKSSKQDLKKFGLTIGVALIVLGCFLFWRKKDFCIYFLIIGDLFSILAISAPLLLKPFQKVWMSLVLIMGWFATRIILSIIFYLVLTPLAFILRMSGKEFLDLKIDKAKNSYWCHRDDTAKISQKEYYEKQF